MPSCVPPEEHYKRIYCTFFRFVMFGKIQQAILRQNFNQSSLWFLMLCFRYQIQLHQVVTQTDHIDFSLMGPFLDAPFYTVRSTTLMSDHKALI